MTRILRRPARSALLAVAALPFFLAAVVALGGLASVAWGFVLGGAIHAQTNLDFNLATENSAAYGIAWDGTNFWVVDYPDAKVYAYDSSGVHVPELDFDLATENGHAYGIGWDGTKFWVTDLDDEKVYAYDSSGVHSPGLDFDLSTDNSNPYGIGWDGTNFFVVDRNDRKVYAYDSSGVHVPELDFDLRGETVNPNSIAWDGTKFFVVDRNDGRTVYAYDSSGVHAPGLDFQLAGGNSHAYGIAWDGTKLWVNDLNDRKVYAYDFERVGPSSGTPGTPETAVASRSGDYTEVTITWSLLYRARTYEIRRATAFAVSSGDVQRIEYGDDISFFAKGLVTGREAYTDNTVEVGKTYQYRIRALSTESGPWSDYFYSGALSPLDLESPSNVAVSREHDNTEVTVSWTAPEGDFDNYTIQRQELVVVEGSTLFGNRVSLGSGTWLPGSTTSYTDSSILPGQTYEYRVAAVKNDVVGDYTESWVRSSPVRTSLGSAPRNFGFDESTDRLLDDRREFWMVWDALDGADDYDVEVMVANVAQGTRTMEHYIVTDPTAFRTSYGRQYVRVRGRKHDDQLCGDGDGTLETGEYCPSEWTIWYDVRFTPKVSIDTPALVDDTADASIMELRENATEAIEGSLGAAGAPVDAGIVLQFLSVLVATVLGGISIAVAWRVGMAPLGVGMGFAITVLVLFTAYRLFGIPLAWPVAIQVVLACAGAFAVVRQTGVFR